MQPLKSFQSPMSIRLVLAAVLLLVATTVGLTHAHTDAGVEPECVACSLSGLPVPSAAIDLSSPPVFAAIDAIPRPEPAQLPAPADDPHPARAPPVAP